MGLLKRRNSAVSDEMTVKKLKMNLQQQGQRGDVISRAVTVSDLSDTRTLKDILNEVCNNSFDGQHPSTIYWQAK